MTNIKQSPQDSPAPVQGQGQLRCPDQWDVYSARDIPPPYQGEANKYYASVPAQQNYSQYPPSQYYGYNGYPPQPSYASPLQQQYAYPPIPPASQAPQYGGAAAGVPPQTQASDIKQEHPGAAAPMPPAEDRGVLGALAGGAAGAYAGHKLHHGFLGAVGGAFAGHKIQDAMHHHNKPAAPPASLGSSPAAAQPYAPSHPHQYPPPQAHGGFMLGNFTQSSSKIGLDRNYDLVAECVDIHGDTRLSSISLNSVLTNDDGRFRWVNPGQETGDFGASARNVRLLERGRFLEAELQMVNGQWRWERICLDERIENSDGNLRKI